MANQLDELNPEIREEGLNTNVIAKKLPVKVGVGSTIFEILLWICGIIPGVIREITEKTTIPLIAGGLIRSKPEVIQALQAGVIAVSSSCPDVWEM